MARQIMTATIALRASMKDSTYELESPEKCLKIFVRISPLRRDGELVNKPTVQIAIVYDDAMGKIE
jgi:hypothetical protein